MTATTARDEQARASGLATALRAVHVEKRCATCPQPAHGYSSYCRDCR